MQRERPGVCKSVEAPLVARAFLNLLFHALVVLLFHQALSFQKRRSAEFKCAENCIIAERLCLLVATSRAHAAAAKLLAVHQRLIRRLTVQFQKQLPVPPKLLRVRNVATEIDEISIRPEAVAIQFRRFAARASDTERDSGAGGREACIYAFPFSGIRRVGNVTTVQPRPIPSRTDRIVSDGRFIRREADGDGLIKALPIHTEAERLVKAFLRRQSEHPAQTKNFPATSGCHAAERRNITVLLRAREHEAERIYVAETPEVICGEHLHLARILRRHLVTRTNSMAELPQVCVTE